MIWTALLTTCQIRLSMHCARFVFLLMLNPICDELDRFLACALLNEGGVIRNVLEMTAGDLDA